MTHPDVFLSYSREDQVVARGFAEALEREGFKVWWDQTLNPGEDYDEVTENALLQARAVVVLWSKHSVASRWVRAEATQADRAGKLVPVMIESCSRPIMFELKQTSDLSHWQGDRNDSAWVACMSGIRRHVQKEGPVSTPVSHTAIAAASPPGNQTKGGDSRRWIAMTLVAAVLIALGVGYFWKRGAGTADAPTASTGPAAQAGPVTLAVLPFADLSAAHDQEYFSDGLTEEILNQLAQIRELTVTGRTSSFSFKGKNEDLRVIAQKLGVAYLLEGSVRRDGDNLRITAQLNKDGAHRWSQTYARELKDVFTVQEDIAKDVARALSITLDVGSMSRAKGGTTNVEAYDRYLRARSLTLQGGRENAAQAAQLLRAAVVMDPNFSLAWLGLGDALRESSLGLPGREAAALDKEAEGATQRAVMLAPESRGAQSVRINELAGQHKWAEATAAYTAFENSEPVDADSLIGLGGGLDILTSTGRMGDAIRLAKKTTQIEPLSLGTSTNLQILLYMDRQYEASQKEVDRSLGLSGNHQRAHFRTLILSLIRKDVDSQVLKAQFRAVLSDDNVSVPFLRELSEVIGDRKAAQAVLRRAFEDPANQEFAASMVIYQLADALEDSALALDAVRRVIKLINIHTVLWMAPHSAMRTEPGFKDLVREAGLVDYWRSSGNWGDYCKPIGTDDFECR